MGLRSLRPAGRSNDGVFPRMEHQVNCTAPFACSDPAQASRRTPRKSRGTPHRRRPNPTIFTPKLAEFFDSGGHAPYITRRRSGATPRRHRDISALGLRRRRCPVSHKISRTCPPMGSPSRGANRAYDRVKNVGVANDQLRPHLSKSERVHELVQHRFPARPHALEIAMTRPALFLATEQPRQRGARVDLDQVLMESQPRRQNPAQIHPSSRERTHALPERLPRLKRGVLQQYLRCPLSVWRHIRLPWISSPPVHRQGLSMPAHPRDHGDLAHLHPRTWKLASHAGRQGQRSIHSHHRPVVHEPLEVVEQNRIPEGSRFRITGATATMFPLHPPLFEDVGLVVSKFKSGDRGRFASTATEADANKSLKTRAPGLRLRAQCSMSSTEGMCWPRN